MVDPRFASMVEAAAAIACGEISSLELTHACLERAHRIHSQLNCFIRIEDELALRAAQRCDALRAAGEPLGVLHGVPIAVKDIFYDPERATSCGSRLREGFRATTKATVLERLHAAGAVNLGALSMTEFAVGPTSHNVFNGPCRNPWEPAHIACGSSSGSGAAVAARVIFGSLGSDTGGSIRLPAAANGVLGLKPTYGRVSRTGVMPLSWSLDHVGPLARNAIDLARLLGVIAGYDSADPSSSARPVPDYEAALTRGVGGLRIGIPVSFFWESVAPEVGHALQAALRVLVELGARQVEIVAPAPEHLTELGRAIQYSEAAAVHGHWLRTCAQSYSPQVRARVTSGIAIPAAVYLEALQLRPQILRHFVTEVFSKCDVLATPVIAVPVPTLAETDVGAAASMWKVISELVRCTAPFNFLGVPALSVPVGTTLAGPPVGLQLVGPPFSEARLLRVAAAYQSATNWHERVPPVS
jgi:aspartyl-tRNA(Asn)/glutamyl-tRNA(Gln) amidotransferase subunit A